MKLNYPKVHKDQNQKVFISFFINKKRYRLYNGKRIGTFTNPNSFPLVQRIDVAKLLAAEAYTYINNGGLLLNYRSSEVITGKLTDLDYLNLALEVKLKGSYSKKYKNNLNSFHRKLILIMAGDKLNSSHVNTLLNSYTSNTSYNTVRRHINTLVNEAVNQGLDHNPLANIKSRKAKATLNKPFKDTAKILNEIKDYNHNLYLCCLMTFGCLLRPHREIRELTWGDFSNDLGFINLSGDRNKSGRNRIVPVPSYIKDLLTQGESNHNIFSGNAKPLNEDYFKTLWSRFKQRSKLLEQGQTLYSFRHTGAIEIFKRTGSITKLQKAMGHSTINVSLTYLRGLEVSELTENDMPKI